MVVGPIAQQACVQQGRVPGANMTYKGLLSGQNHVLELQAGTQGSCSSWLEPAPGPQPRQETPGQPQTRRLRGAHSLLQAQSFPR